MLKSIPISRALARDEAASDLERKARICAQVLAEARKLSRSGRVGALCHQLIVRAGEVLDDMDEILVSLDPAVNRASFVVTASLHRELATIQSGMANPRRRPFLTPSADEP